MEVLCFFSSDNNLISHLESFLNCYAGLVLGFRDKDTAYYENPKTNRNEIYFHFIPNALEHQFAINYTRAEENHIRNFFEERDVCSFDIQYRDERFLIELLKKWKYYLEAQGVAVDKQILIDHPHRGVLRFSEIALMPEKRPGLLRRISLYLAKP